MRVLLIGGSKSGKSSLGQELVLTLSDGGRAVYWATMEPVDGEDETRIQRHTEDRAGLGFETLECGRRIIDRIDEVRGASVLFDSITALLANEMFSGSEPDLEAGARTAAELIEVSKAADNFVCVVDDIFRDCESYEASTEGFRRSLAEVCRVLAAEFDAAAEVCCGIPKVLKGSLNCMEGIEL